MGMTFTGRGRGKLLLFGEHAAVKGYPALGMALDRSITITLEASASAGSWELEGFEETEKAIARAVMKRIDEAVADLPRGGSIRVKSDLPQGRGFGSSAALCVALADAALGAAGTPEAIRHRSLVWAIAHHAEAYFHGTPSGIDTGLATLGGLLSFRPRPPELPEARRVRGWPLHLLVGSVPRAGDAKSLIARVREAAKDETSPASASLRRLGELAVGGTALLETAVPDPAALGGMALEAEAELDALGLADPAIKSLLAIGTKAGALGGKMSGAGGGGAFWLVYASGEEAKEGADRLARQAEKNGLAPDLTLEVLEFSGAPHKAN